MIVTYPWAGLTFGSGTGTGIWYFTIIQNISRKQGILQQVYLHGGRSRLLQHQAKAEQQQSTGTHLVFSSGVAVWWFQDESQEAGDLPSEPAG